MRLPFGGCSRWRSADLQTLRVGTRGSRLARAQTQEAVRAIEAVGMRVEVIVCRTLGDQQPEARLESIAGPGVFARAIEEALLDGRIDVAVHSAKDVGITPLEGTELAAYFPRADVRDVLVSRSGLSLAELPVGARVGTSSRRRAAQLRSLRPDVETPNIRGNVDTRIEKVQRGDYDATVLAAAGLARLGRLDTVTEYLPIDRMLPAPGQGAVVLQARRGERETIAWLESLDHRPTALAVRAERAVLASLGAGCALPVAALGHVRAEEVTVVGAVYDDRATRTITAQHSAPADDPEAAGHAVAEALREQGVQELIGWAAS